MSENTIETEIKEVFHCHFDLVKYLAETDAWNTKSDVLGSVETYYSCISLGGKLWNTEAMPLNFTTERLLTMYQVSRKKVKRSSSNNIISMD